MRKKSVFLSVALLLALSLFLTACGDKKTDSKGKESSKGDTPKLMQMLTGGTSGTYYPLGGQMAKIISDETGIKTDSASSNASADNVIALADGTADIAFVQTDVISNAIDGTNAFEGKKVDNVQALGSLYPETIQIVTTEKSGIKSVEDLKGKTVSVGAPGSGTYINAEQILEIYGMTMDDIKPQNLDFGESTGGIQDGTIEAAFITAGTPTGAVEGLTASAKVSIVPIDKEKVDALVEKYPYYADDKVEKGTYGLKEDVQTVAVLAMLAVRDDLSEDAVYKITKAIYDHPDKIKHDKAQFIKPENGLDGIGVDLHPGAKKYFDEKGVEKK